VKHNEYDIPDWQSLERVTTHIFDEIGQQTLISVFETWTNKLEWVREHKGKYFHQEMKNEQRCLKIQRKNPRIRTF
jgi:hypothetical protein